MPVCSVSTCRNTSSSVGNSGIIFHSFPREDKRALEWFMKCRRRDKKRSNSTDRMCSIHFEESCYERDIGHELLGKPPSRKLKITASPTLNLPYIFVKPSEARKVLTPSLARQLNKRSSGGGGVHKMQTRRSVSPNENLQKERTPNGDLRRNVSLQCSQLPTVNEEETDSVNDKSVRLVSKTHCEDLLSEIFNDESLMDLTISVDQKRIRAHRVVLQQASGYFKRNLANEDASTSSEYLIRLNNINYEDMNRIMAFIYQGEISVKASDLDRFLEATEFLDVQDLKRPAKTPTSIKEPSSKNSNNAKTNSSSQNQKSKKNKSENNIKKRLKNNALFKPQYSKKKVIKVVLAELRQGIVATLSLLY